MGGIGNCLFILITGWLSVYRRFDAKSILRLWVQVWIASVVGQMAYCCITGTMPSIKNLIKTVLPVTFNVYWYFSAYLVIYLLMPFINKALDSIEQKYHKLLIIVLFVLFSVIPTFTTTAWLTGINQIAMMVTLYITGNYCRKYVNQFYRKSYLWVISSVFFIFFTELILKRFTGYDPFYFAWEMNKTSIVILSVAWFMAIVNADAHVVKPVKIISKHAFGIYLIHIGWISPLLFERFFANSKYYDSPWMILQMIVYLFAVLSVCVTIDFIYGKLYNKILKRTVDNVGERINSKLL